MSDPIKKRKRSSGPSPSACSVAYLKSLGCHVENVEKRLPIPGKWVTRDLWNMADLILIWPGRHSADCHFPVAPETPFGDAPFAALVQVTTNANLSAREKKVLANPVLKDWLAVGKFFLHGWARMGERGMSKDWTLTERTVTLEDLK